jgi:hypothetical protein
VIVREIFIQAFLFSAEWRLIVHQKHVIMEIDSKYDHIEECTEETKHQHHHQWNKEGR